MVTVDKMKTKVLTKPLIKEYHALKSSNLMFGFKNNLSTTQCTFFMMETVNYYNFNRSNVYVLLLDATKVFD